MCSHGNVLFRKVNVAQSKSTIHDDDDDDDDDDNDDGGGGDDGSNNDNPLNKHVTVLPDAVMHTHRHAHIDRSTHTHTHTHMYTAMTDAGLIFDN